MLKYIRNLLGIMSLFMFFQANADSVQDKEMEKDEVKRIKHDNAQRHQTEEEFESPIYGEW
jgi:hypothetical protein